MLKGFRSTLAVAGSLAAVAMIGMLIVPSLASAKVMHFKGRATGEEADKNMRLTFDVTVRRGRAVRISDIYVTNIDYACANGADASDRNVRFFDPAKVSRRGKFEHEETLPPPGYDNGIFGAVHFARHGRPPRVTGWVRSRFGYDPEDFDKYNCIAVEDFVATPVR
jgi:hypothetical protein